MILLSFLLISQMAFIARSDLPSACCHSLRRILYFLLSSAALDVLSGKALWMRRARKFALVVNHFKLRGSRKTLFLHFQNKTEMNDFDNRQIFCVKGCNDASNFYFEWIKQEVSSPAAPALVPDSLTSRTLSLEWFVPAKFLELAKGNLFKKTKNETYFVQCHEDAEDDWKICGNQTIYENSTIHMERLQPYTKYKVKSTLIQLPTLRISFQLHFSFASLCCCPRTKRFTRNRASSSAPTRKAFPSHLRPSSRSARSTKRASWCRGSRG